MPQQTPEQVIEAQRQDWNRVAAGWEKWDRFFDEQMAFLNHRLVGDARVRAGMHVLDLGSGTGYPALLAAQTAGPSGRVIGIDLADQMLAAADRKAETARAHERHVSHRRCNGTSVRAAFVRCRDQPLLSDVSPRDPKSCGRNRSRTETGRMAGSSGLVFAGEESLSQDSDGCDQAIHRGPTARSDRTRNFSTGQTGRTRRSLRRKRLHRRDRSRVHRRRPVYGNRGLFC